MKPEVAVTVRADTNELPTGQTKPVAREWESYRCKSGQSSTLKRAVSWRMRVVFVSVRDVQVQYAKCSCDHILAAGRNLGCQILDVRDPRLSICPLRLNSKVVQKAMYRFFRMYGIVPSEEFASLA